MKKFCRTIEGLPWIVKLLGVLFYGVLGNIYRLCRSIAAENVVGIILSVVLLLCGGFVVLWVLDVVFIILGKKIWWID